MRGALTSLRFFSSTKSKKGIVEIGGGMEDSAALIKGKNAPEISVFAQK